MEPARVLIVDDSRIFRAALEAALAGQPEAAVVGSVYSGEKALAFLETNEVDLVTLDVEMPGMSGLQTLAAIGELNARRPAERQIGVVMVSSFTQRGADVTLAALESGAFDFVAKPSAMSAEESVAHLQQDLRPKIRAFLTRRRRLTTASLGPTATASPTTAAATSAVRPRRLRAVVIAASTGGPPALAGVLAGLATLPAPIFVVQHMPPTFTRSLAEGLARKLGREVVEANDSDLVRPERVYVAPGGLHLALRRDGAGRLLTACTNQPAEEGCRPSANVLFRSAAAACGSELAALILTGMGCDGTAGLAAVRRAGGLIIAQDEDTSVVWGMPRSAVEAGLPDLVLPLGEIAAAVRRLALP